MNIEIYKLKHKNKNIKNILFKCIKNNIVVVNIFRNTMKLNFKFEDFIPTTANFMKHFLRPCQVCF